MGLHNMTYNLSISEDALENDPFLLSAIGDAGITDVWITGFLYGNNHYSFERISKHKKLIESAGMRCHVINIPLGHPGDALGSMYGDIPLTPPAHWKMAIGHDGCPYYGTSLHAPAIAENARYLRDLSALGIDKVFLDDDFRLAKSPGIIGGCFCDEHRKSFCDLYGYGNQDWNHLLEAINARKLTPILQSWIDYICDELTNSFHTLQRAASAELGIMVMYLGAEKAGVRLSDYKNVPFRVGEGMFDDASFSQVKGKTNELFSSLFHRRFTSSRLAYSETTAFPANSLSAQNMASKLAIPLLSDVWNVMYMSGLSAFPREYWDLLGPAMQKIDKIHSQIAGKKKCGPFKHYWGMHSRCIGDDDPYSLFLALGVPFEVTEELKEDGWTFLSDADADALHYNGSNIVARKRFARNISAVPENLDALFAFKHQVKMEFRHVPFVEEDMPVVCAYYPEINAALLWNLSAKKANMDLCFEDKHKRLTLDALDICLQPLHEM